MLRQRDKPVIQQIPNDEAEPVQKRRHDEGHKAGMARVQAVAIPTCRDACDH